MPDTLFHDTSIHPLVGVDPELPPQDLAILKEIVGGASVVGLGEPTHGQKEINQLRDRVTRYLVEHMGFRVIAMEDSAAKCRLVNDFIVHGTGTADSALGQQNFWTWRTRELLALITWLRYWNVAHPHDPVRFIGVDVQDTEHPANLLLEVLARYSAKSEPPRRRTLTDLIRFNRHSENPHTRTLQDIAKLNMHQDRYSARLHRKASATLDAVRAIVESTQQVSSEDHDLALDCLDSLSQALSIWKANSEPTLRGDLPVGWYLRDSIMATRVMAPHHKGQKTVVWAHNGHLGADMSDQNPTGNLPMGGLLRRELGENYVIFAGMFGEGAYRGIDTSTMKSATKDVGAPPPETFDARLLNTCSAPACLVDMKEPRPAALEMHTTRWGDARMLDTPEMLAEIRPALAWNAIAFVRNASPSEPLTPHPR